MMTVRIVNRQKQIFSHTFYEKIVARNKFCYRINYYNCKLYHKMQNDERLCDTNKHHFSVRKMGFNLETFQNSGV